MRIKRFIAPDMRTALRMVRQEQGPDAVILSNRPVEGGIEIVAATDYDESLAQQALRAALPSLEPAPVAAPAPTPMPPTIPSWVAEAAPAAPAPEPLIRGRAVFAIGEAPPVAKTPAPVQARVETPTPAPVAAPAPPDTSRFEAMMAALIPQGEQFQAADALLPSPRIEGEGRNQDHFADGNAVEGSASYVDLSTNHSADPHPNPSPGGRGAQALHLVASTREPDTGMVAMREELATMRQLIERELHQFSTQRLRGSPARAAVFDALIGYGCDESLAQTVAGRIDARLDPAHVREPMLVELARTLTVARSEPLDDGGVIALVGPTGAGKTTTAAKLAARFAQRHRARDVALVTTDTERAGASEQLHILGRRLGITVCEAAGPEALSEALEQLADYPLVLVDTAGHGLRDRALLGQILWLRAAQRVRSLLVLPANAHPHDLGEVVRRYRPAAPEGVVLTKLDETGRLGSALSVMVQHGLSVAYTTDGQQVPADLAAADAMRLVTTLEKVRRAADNPLGSLDMRPAAHPTEDCHAIAS